MSRTIKFRAYDSTTRTMHLNPFNGKLGGMNDIFDNTGNWEYMQFTGLYDKNGNEIFEGDIIDYGCNRYMPVEFINGCFCICKNTAMPTLMSLYPVIGNIYENPELLTK